MRRPYSPGHTSGVWGHVRATFDFADVISLSIITIIKLKVSYIARSIKGSNLTIKSIIISSYSNSSTGANYIYLYLVYRAALFY